MLNAVTKDRGQNPAREVRTHAHRPEGDAPRTPGERMTKLRKDLGLRQEDVATQIKFMRKDGMESTMSRSAYCMYEANAVTMDIDRVVLIARVLKTTPEYLAYGISDDNAVDEVEWAHGEFSHVRKWSINDDWLYARYEAEASELVLIQVDQPYNEFKEGDMAVVRLNAKPGARGGDFVFACDDEKGAQIAHIAKPSRSSDYVVIDENGERHFDDNGVVLLGKVIGKFG